MYCPTYSSDSLACPRKWISFVRAIENAAATDDRIRSNTKSFFDTIDYRTQHICCRYAAYWWLYYV